jgi:hypothetical protein
MEHLQDIFMNSEVHYIISGASNIVYYSNEHKDDVPIDSLKFYWASDLQMNGALVLIEADSSTMTINFLETTGKSLYKFSINKNKK